MVRTGPISTEILINARPNQTRVAYVENRVLIDLKVERKTSPTLVGSIYKGRVTRVLPGMQAAFLDVGLARAAFLYVGDIITQADSEKSLVMIDEEGEKTREEIIIEGAPTSVEEAPRAQIQDLLKEGQMLLVQVAKDPLRTKGARITTHISLPGRHIVYMPTLEHVGISRRIADEEERERLRQMVEELKPNGGVIVRTAGEGALKENIDADLDYLYRLWKDVEKNFEKRKTPGLVHSEMDVEMRALRDMLNENVDRVIVDDLEAFKRVSGFVSQLMPKFKNKVVFHEDAQPLFDQYEIDQEIARSLGRQIWLKSGGYLVIDEAEALVVIDVNTGRFVGKKDLEDTIFTTNVEAAREVAHQLRIRNCGGIIIIDFIDMERETHRQRVLNILQTEVEKDRSRATVMGMSELGLVEMTRKRMRPSLVSTLCEPCPYCEGRGYIKKKITVANEIFRALEREESREGAKMTTVVHCHGEIADWIYEEEAETLDFVEQKLGRSIAFKVEPEFHLEQHEIHTL